MTFDPKNIGLSSDAGPTPSRTLFYTTQGVMSVTSNGLPYPALADATNVNEKNYNFKFVYRAKSSTQSPQVCNNDNIGIFVNGVVFKHVPVSTRIPYRSTKSPAGYKFNTVHLAEVFEKDSAHGYNNNGTYEYHSGKFLKDAWNTPLVYNNRFYYSQTNYNGDNFRHADGHSKVLGFSFDGYPIYGPYGYVAATDNTSGTKLIQSGYVTLPNDSHRPRNYKYNDIIETSIGEVELDAGSFIQDYIYKKNKGDLDEQNGRYCVTPDFPEGTYAYFLTFKDETLDSPAYPYIVGPSTYQQRNFVEEIAEKILPEESLWTIPTGKRISTLIERNVTELILPLTNANGITVEVISGSLPPGLRLEENIIRGTVYEVIRDTIFNVVIRAKYENRFEDRTLEFVVTGADDPVWQTQEGLLPIGENNSLFILDSSYVDFQLAAVDPDISAGDELSYYIANDDGVLPPGITLTEDGRIQGIVEPLLSLDKRFQGGGYDSMPFGGIPMDYATLSSNGYGSFFYDTVGFGFNEPTSNPRKLNRYYPFAVTVTDGDTFVRREFKIYLVGDDYLKADNTIMQAGTGVFTADATNVRTPTWLTPRDLGFKRANNNTTLYLEIIDNPTLEGVLIYTLESVNDDGTPSELPPGLTLDSTTGEIVGRLPYQPAITQNYKFSVRATRITNDLDTVEIFANYFEDTLLGKDSFKIYKIDLTGDIDGVNDLFELVGRDILLGSRQYKVTNVDSRNQDYDIIFLDQTLAPSIPLLMSRTARTGTNDLFVSRLSESEKDKYQGRVLRFADNETYTITNIVPYIEYDIRQSDPNTDPILPSKSPRQIEVNTNYFVGDYVIFNSESGGNDKVYKAIVTHNTQPVLDVDGNLVLNDDGIVQINFETSNWQLVAEGLYGLSLQDRLTATKQALEAEYGYTAYIDVIDKNNWRVKIPSTSTSRVIENIRDFFSESDSTKLIISVLRDDEHKIKLDKNLSRQLNQGRNIGIALFQNDSFRESLIVAASDEVDIPSTAKTFELRVIGEIDSNIEWITPSDLGIINANFTSTLKVQAQTTVPDTKMIYTVKKGKLPFGMYLNYEGEIIGAARQFGNEENPGLTTFDNITTTWDGFFPGETSFDRTYKFTVEARDRFNYTAIEREFLLKVEDLDDIQYTDVFMRPMLPQTQRIEFRNFISNSDVFNPENIYRPGDPKFGIQKNMDMLVYAGIEAKSINEFVAAAAKNAKRKKYILGDFKTAKAVDPDSNETIYEVVYIDVQDPAMSDNGKTMSKFNIATENKITADSIQYSVKDDETKTGAGYENLPVYGRGVIRFIVVDNEELVIETRGDTVDVDVDNQDFELEIRDGEVTIELQISDSEPNRFRPKTNTIKADSDAVKVSQTKDRVRYRSSIEHIRDNIEKIGLKERNFLPLWMRSPQDQLQELDYVTAIPVCYCKPGTSEVILNNIKNYGFDTKNINYDIDRYIVREIDIDEQEKYVLFANYQFNV